jgi:hypothetical protein
VNVTQYLEPHAQRIDLVTDTADAFYSSFEHRTFNGYRIYPS